VLFRSGALLAPEHVAILNVATRRQAKRMRALALRAAAVLLSDESSEWLSRALFQKWVREARFDRAVYSPRAPRCVGCERYDVGWGPTLGLRPGEGAADSPKLVTQMALRTGQMLCFLKRWLGPEVAARKPKPPDEYRSSKHYLRRYRKGEDMAAVANIIQPLSYMTPTVGLQGIELWSDDRFFWFNLCGFRPTTFSEDGDGFAVHAEVFEARAIEGPQAIRFGQRRISTLVLFKFVRHRFLQK
jgi:hypothetical protein